MKKWLTSLVLLFALVGGVLAGTPVFSGNADSGMSAMACCKKKKNCNGAKSMSAAMACCLLKCNSPVPNAPSPSFNFSPSTIIVSDSIIKQIASLLLLKEKPTITIAFSFERVPLPQKFQPKYLQHHSFLI